MDQPRRGLASGDSLELELTGAVVEPDAGPMVRPPKRRRLLLAASLALVSLNLRPLFSSLAAVMPEVRQSTGAAPALASLMTTLPVLCLGLFAAAAPALSRRFGAERVILVLLLVLAAGTALRGFGSVSAILIGSVLAGGSIAVVNVLLPGLVKRDFPDRVALMTGLYSMALCAGAAAAAAGTVPIERSFGGAWGKALAAWSLPALLVALIWGPQARPEPPKIASHQPGRSLWREPLAWQVTLFMGLQSALAYCTFGWMAPLLRARGLDSAVAGYVVSFCVIMQTVASLIAPPLATRGKEQGVISVVLVALSIAGFVGFVFLPLPAVWIFAGLQGIGQGGLIAVALTVIVLRSPDAMTAARLSSMAQSVGYTLAAVGPLVMGLIFTSTGSPQATAALVLPLGIACAAAGWGAGKDRQLSR